MTQVILQDHASHKTVKLIIEMSDLPVEFDRGYDGIAA